MIKILRGKIKDLLRHGSGYGSGSADGYGSGYGYGYGDLKLLEEFKKK